MNLSQATELYTLITTCRHVGKMDVHVGAYASDQKERAGCLLCEGVRHGLYSQKQGFELEKSYTFANHFGCTEDEGHDVVYVTEARNGGGPKASRIVTGENYYQAGKELIKKYGHWEAVNGNNTPKKIMSYIKRTDPKIEGSTYRQIITHEPANATFEQCMNELRVTITED